MLLCYEQFVSVDMFVEFIFAIDQLLVCRCCSSTISAVISFFGIAADSSFSSVCISAERSNIWTSLYSCFSVRNNLILKSLVWTRAGHIALCYSSACLHTIATVMLSHVYENLCQNASVVYGWISQCSDTVWWQRRKSCRAFLLVFVELSENRNRSHTTVEREVAEISFWWGGISRRAILLIDWLPDKLMNFLVFELPSLASTKILHCTNKRDRRRFGAYWRVHWFLLSSFHVRMRACMCNNSSFQSLCSSTLLCKVLVLREVISCIESLENISCSLFAYDFRNCKRRLCTRTCNTMLLFDA